jgi:carboxypeptidase Q
MSSTSLEFQPLELLPGDLLRPPGAFEELFCLFDHHFPTNGVVAAQITGHTTVQQWRDALDAVQQRHPLLSARIDETFNRVPHFRRVFWSLIRMLTRIISLSIAAALAVPLLAQTSTPANTVSEPTRTAVRELIGSILVDGKAYEYDRELADGIGPRITGSANYDRAVAWSMEQFRSLGLTNVHTESFTSPASWEPEVAATGTILEPRKQTLHIYSAGWSPSTPDGGVEGNVVYLPRVFPTSELDAEKDKIADSIVLFDNQSFGGPPTFEAIVQATLRVHALHPRAVIFTFGLNGNGTQNALLLTTGGQISDMPVAQLGLEDDLLIKRMLDKGPVTVQFSFKNRIRRNVEVQNVVAEIPGRDVSPGSPSSVVVVGAHLDSWHPGTGAQDNGTGVASILEIARAVQSLGRPPRRTLRFVLFGGEEEGLMGSHAYVERHKAEMPSLDAVLISDTGSQRATGWYVMGREDEKDALAAIKPLLTGLGADQTSSDTDFLFRSDHAGFNVLGVPTLMLWNSMDRYETLVHQASDTFDSVVESDLDQTVAVTGSTAYAIADAPQPFAAHLSHAEVADMFRKCNAAADFNSAKVIGWVPSN